MAHATHAHTEIRNPGSLATPAGIRMGLIACAAIGAIAFGAALGADPKRAWVTFLQGHFYFMSLALGGAFFAAIQWLTGAMWSAGVRRVSESFTAYLPVVFVSFIVLYFGMHTLYEWTHPEHVKGDVLLEAKEAYLNVPFFVIRNLIAIGAWLFLTWRLISNSLRQDATKDVRLTLRNRFLAPPFLLVFAVGFTMASFDQLMSLDPHWFSTMFGVYCFAGLFYMTNAMTCLMTLFLKKRGKLDGIVNDHHIHDIGKFMFAFTVFWAYIAFSQFMLIWYANLPEETMYYLKRFHGDWMYVSVFLLLGKFVVPFLLLLPRSAKRDPKTLTFVGIWMLFAQWIDVMWMVQPEFFADGPVFGWIELGVPLMFLGVFGLLMFRFLARNNVVAIGDPRLAESAHHHHQ